ncbi:MAG TPA: MarR family transcriptional regulator [Anaerolineales bacterium]|nr:MarR family transcriptional regulator [Anaerolineales bacterium]
MTKLLDTCAHELMDTAPQIIQTIRSEMRRGRGSDISIPQFRTLAFIERNPDSSLSRLAEHLGLTLPSVSKLVDGLVNQKLIIRQASKADRRRLTLVLTKAGDSIVNTARAGAQVNLTDKLGGLSNAELETIHQAMQLLRPIFVNQSR